MASHAFLLAVVWGSVVVVGASALLAWRQRPRPGATAFAVAMFAATWWVATSAVGLFTTDAELRLFWTKVEWAGATAFPVAWLAFALSYTGRDEWLTPTRLAGITAFPAVTLLLALTNGVGHTLVYRETTYESFGSVSLFFHTYGPWFWVHVGYSLALLVAGGALVVGLVTQHRELYRGQAAALVLVVAPPLVGTVVSAAGLSPVPGFDPTPFTFVISGAAGLAALTQLSFLDAVPVPTRVARRSVVENVDAGVVVTDTTGHVVDANPRAEELLEADVALEGDRVSTWFPDSVTAGAASLDGVNDDATNAASADVATDESDDAASEGVDADPSTPGTVVVAAERGPRTEYFEVSATELTDRYDAVTGRVYLLRDVTARHERLQRLNVLNRVLRHNLRNEMNVVYGLADSLEQGVREPETVAGQMRTKAEDLIQLSEKAREMDAVLDDEERDPADVGRVVEIECERVAEEYPDVAVEFTVPDGPVRVPAVVGTVVRNLVENAAQHNTASEPWVEVTVTVRDGRVELTVADNGPGIPDQDRAAIDADAETQLEHASGLGLWIANWGVSSVGGSLTTTDRADGGTAVTVTVPVAGGDRH